MKITKVESLHADAGHRSFDPRAYEALVALMYAVRRQASGGVVQQAIGAIENALLDIKARALGIPVYARAGHGEA